MWSPRRGRTRRPRAATSSRGLRPDPDETGERLILRPAGHHTASRCDRHERTHDKPDDTPQEHAPEAAVAAPEHAEQHRHDDERRPPRATDTAPVGTFDRLPAAGDLLGHGSSEVRTSKPRSRPPLGRYPDAPGAQGNATASSPRRDVPMPLTPPRGPPQAAAPRHRPALRSPRRAG